MYFDTTKGIDTTDKVQYNYYSTSIYKSQIQDVKNGYVKVPYSSKSNEPNIILLGVGYVTKTLYIVKPIHVLNGKNIDYDAELIIEHLPLTNFTDPLYTCFPLKTSKGVVNAIDGILSIEDTVLQLNDSIYPQDTIVYKNNMIQSGMIVVFTRPIYVDSTFSGMKTGGLEISPYVDEYSVMKVSPILGNIEGFGGKSKSKSAPTPTPTSNLWSSMNPMDSLSDMNPLKQTDPPKSKGGPKGNSKGGSQKHTMPAKVDGSSPVVVAGYCQPIDETDPTIAETAQVVIPMDSHVVTDTATSSTLKTMMNLFGFFIIVIVAVIATPIAHKIMIVELIMDNTAFSSQQLLNRSNAADVYTGLILFGSALAFLNYGMINNMPFASVMGMYIFVFFITSVIILQYQRVFNPVEYLKQFAKEGQGSTASFEKIEMDWGFFSDNLFELFFKKSMTYDPVKKMEVPTYEFQLGWLVVILFYGLFNMILYALQLTKKAGSFFLTSFYFYGITFGIYMRALINHYRFQSSKKVEATK